MEVSCRVSCAVCDPHELDLGLPQKKVDSLSQEDFDATMVKAKAYVEKVAADPFLSKALLVCKNKNELCAFWGKIGEVSSSTTSIAGCRRHERTWMI
jgi:hypothetical protein